VDDRAVREARHEILHSPTLRGRRLRDVVHSRENHLVFPWLFGGLNLTLNARRARTIGQLAMRCGLPPEKLENAVAAYDAMAAAGGPDPLGKPGTYLRPLDRGPFRAIRCDLDSLLFPAPCITLGGLDVDAGQAVRRSDGSTIPGLYAVGRCAAGVASRSYVSGLSLADCVFSGRNAGASVTAT
jgi:3-oxo-5alpha-steroid 4-dehydrogenase